MQGGGGGGLIYIVPLKRVLLRECHLFVRGVGPNREFMVQIWVVFLFEISKN